MFDQVKLQHFNKTASKNNPERVLKDLEIKPGYTIGDIGSGGGYYTLRLARLARSSGRVYAVDIEQESLDFIRKEAEAAHLEQQVVLVRGDEKNSNLPKESFDLLFLRNSFHHIKNRVEYFKNLKRCLKPEGRVAIIDHKKGSSFGPGIGHGTSEGEIERVMLEAGFTLVKSCDYLSGQWFFIWK